MTVEVTTTYTVEVHADDDYVAEDIAWGLDLDEIQAQATGSPVDETTAVHDAEEIQRETEDE